MKKLNLITPENMSENIQVDGIYYGVNGRAYVMTEDSKFYVEINRNKVGNKGHITISAHGRTIYLARMIYCLFVLKDAEEYWNLPKSGKFKYLDGDYSNCAVTNLELIPRRVNADAEPVQKVDVWAVRLDYCRGLSFHDLSGKYEVSEAYVRGLCRGFDGVDPRKIKNMLSNT